MFLQNKPKTNIQVSLDKNVFYSIFFPTTGNTLRKTTQNLHNKTAFANVVNLKHLVVRASQKIEYCYYANANSLSLSEERAVVVPLSG